MNIRSVRRVPVCIFLLLATSVPCHRGAAAERADVLRQPTTESRPAVVVRKVTDSHVIGEVFRGGADSLGQAAPPRWYRRLSRGIRLTVFTWGRWVVQVAVLLLVAVAGSMLDAGLWRQWRMHGWQVFTTYVPFAAIVYVLSVFDRRADRLAHVVLLATLLYGLAPWDLIPDRFAVGMVDDAIAVVAASRWFMWRCPTEVLERHARRVQDWRERIRRIQARRQRL